MTDATGLTDEQLKSIADLAKLQMSRELAVSRLTEQLEDAKQKLREVQEVLLPDAMLGVGLESFNLSDGSSVYIDKFYAGKIPDDRAKEAFAWLRENGLDSIIKREVKCLFGKGEDKRAEQILEMLRKQGTNPVDKQGVHPMTLKSFIRERMENGEELPQDLFGAYVGNRAKVTPPQPKK